MKTYLVALLLTTLGIRAEIEFSGFVTTAKEDLFSLSDRDTLQSSGWLKIGQSFGDYTVVSFDRKREVITLKQGARVLEVPLRISQVKDRPGAALPPVISIRIGENGTLQVQDRMVSIDEFSAWVLGTLQTGKETTLRIVVEPKGDHKLVTRIFELCRASGITRVSISTTSEKIPNQSPEPAASSGRG
jgi:biopolymer transport protein ExbD